MTPGNLQIHAQHMGGLAQWLGDLPPDWPITVDASNPPAWRLRFPTEIGKWVEEVDLPVAAVDVPAEPVVVIEVNKLSQMLSVGSWKSLGSEALHGHYLTREPCGGLPQPAVLLERFPSSHLRSGPTELLVGTIELPNEIVIIYGSDFGVVELWRSADAYDHGWIKGELPGYLAFTLQVSAIGDCSVAYRTGFTPLAFEDLPRFGDVPVIDEDAPAHEKIALVMSLSTGEAPLEVTMRALDHPVYQSSAASDNRLPPDVVDRLSTSPRFDVRELVARREGLPEHLSDRLSQDPDYRVRATIAGRSGLPARIRSRLSDDPIREVRDRLMHGGVPTLL